MVFQLSKQFDVPGVTGSAAPTPVPDSLSGLAGTAAAWNDISSKLEYSLGTAEYRDQIAAKFATDNLYGQAVINQQEGPNRGSIENLYNITTESFKSALAAARLSDDVTTGRIDASTAKTLRQEHLRALSQYVPEELGKVQDAFQVMTKEYDEAEGAMETGKALAGAGWNVLKQILTNPEGVIQLSAQSAGNMAPIMAGTLTGSAAGSIVPIVGNVVGGMMGAFAGSFTVEAGHRLIQEADQELQRLHLDPSEENYAQIFTNETFVRTAVKKARSKAAGTALVDSVLSVAAGKFSTRHLRKARVIARSRVPIEMGEEAFLKEINLQLGRITKAAKFKAKIGAYGIEVASEPISELAGQKAAGDKTDIGELAGELLGGVGSSMVTTGVSSAAFGTKLGAGVTAVAAKTIGDVRTQRQYKKKVAKLAEGTDVTQFTNPHAEEAYEPVLAVDVIKAWHSQEDMDPVTKVQLMDQAITIQDQLVENTQKEITKQNKLVEAANNGTATKEELIDLEILTPKVEDAVEAVKVIEQTVNSMQELGAVKQEIQDKINTAVQNKDSAAIIESTHESFGSKGMVDIDSTKIDAAINDPNITPSAKALLTAIQADAKVRQTFKDNAAKNTGEVKEDVFSGQRGINGYSKAIAVSLKAGNVKEAKNQFAKLIKFQLKQKRKQEAFTNAVEAIENNTELSKKDQEFISAIGRKRNKAYVPNTGKFKTEILHNINLEVDALSSAVNVANELFNSKNIEHGFKLTKFIQKEPSIDGKVEQENRTKEKAEKETITKGEAEKVKSDASQNKQDTAPVDKKTPTVSESIVPASDLEKSSTESPMKVKDVDGTVMIMVSGESVNAKQALQDINKEIDLYDKLLRCVKR